MQSVIKLPYGKTHVTVNEAILLTLENAVLPDGFVDVYGSVGDDGAISVSRYVEIKGREAAGKLAVSGFIDACKARGIKPCNPYCRWLDDYTGTPLQNVQYEITVAELALYAAGYGVTVQIDTIALALALALAPATGGEAWKAKALELATDIWLKEFESSTRDMSKSDLSKAIASRLKSMRCVTKTGKQISSGYVERHVLREWTTPTIPE